MSSTLTAALHTVVMPSLGEQVEEGTVTRWLKQPGDRIEIGDPLLEVATDKVDTEIESPFAGTLTEILSAEDDIVPVHAPLAVIRADNCPSPTGIDLEQITGRINAEPTPAPQTAVTSDPVPCTSSSTQQERPETADGGLVGPNPGANDAARVEKLSRIRRTIAARMVASLQTSAQLTTIVEVDISRIGHLRQESKAAFMQRTGRALSFLPFFVKAALGALGANTAINASLNESVTEVTYNRACHLGIAVDGPKGLMVPVIRNADSLSIAGLSEAIAVLADKVRNGRIVSDDLVGGTFTITNTGSRGALFDTPIINKPQSAIMGTGAVVERLVPRRDSDGNLQITVAHMVLPVSVLRPSDHRRGRCRTLPHRRSHGP